MSPLLNLKEDFGLVSPSPKLPRNNSEYYPYLSQQIGDLFCPN